MECDRQLIFPVEEAPHWWRVRGRPSEMAILFHGQLLEGPSLRSAIID